PVARYFSGRFLNAGSGSREITAFLHRSGVTELTRYDIASADPEVILGPIESMPFEDGSFDSALCNAVLEHVVDAERGIAELARVVRPGGHIVVTVPFLQPYHPCPGDYRRYTVDGLAQLGRNAGLEVVELLPVHTIAQTLGWILWEYAREKGGRLRKGAAWLIAFVLTSIWKRTDTRVLNNANTVQAVFRVPDLEEPVPVGDQWRHHPVPAAGAKVRTMLIPAELSLLNYLGEHAYRGEGAIVDAGSFLGGSTIALADGLRRNRRWMRKRTAKPIHSYDRFEVEEWTRGVYFPEETPAGSSFREEYERNIAPYADLVEVHAGEIEDHPWTGGPIEILFIDVAKHWTVCDWVTWQFFPHLIPGRSFVVQQDYLYHHWVAWLHVTMELYADYFEYVCDTELNSVVFRNTKASPSSVLRRNSVDSLSVDERIALMDRAATRFEGKKRDLLVSAKAHFLQMMSEDAAGKSR
ncbi:MAG TPA: class I SAM-dependent methyltransferase, partial [Thermoanaerobaculia bacterium]|nr:class I SAM-dependent methyltransferase [Thermoanaerobaculia bacterium]